MGSFKYYHQCHIFDECQTSSHCTEMLFEITRASAGKYNLITSQFNAKSNKYIEVSILNEYQPSYYNMPPIQEVYSNEWPCGVIHC